MKLSIIPDDGTVCEDGKCYNNLSWFGTPANVHALQFDTASNSGWIEYTDGPNQDITELPEWANLAEAAWDDANNPKPPEPVPPTAEQNKQTALGLLSATDFTEIPSVSDPSSTPHLLNKADFVAYRDQVRIFAVYPVAGDITWPVKPAEQWSDPFENLP